MNWSPAASSSRCAFYRVADQATVSETRFRTSAAVRVFGSSLRMRMSSIMRWRSGVTASDDGFMILLLLKSEAGCLAGHSGRIVGSSQGVTGGLPRERLSPLADCGPSSTLRTGLPDPMRRSPALQSREPVAVGERTHGRRPQADVQLSCRRWTGRQFMGYSRPRVATG